MDFHKAFQAIDTDNSGEISVEELEIYCKKMNYKDTFVKKWLNLFDEDQSGTITYDEFCNTLGMIPKQEIVEKHKVYQAEQAASAAPAAKKEHTVAAAPAEVKKKTKKTGRSRNVAISGSLMKFSRARMFERKAIYRMKKKINSGGGSGHSGTASISAANGASSKVKLTEKVVGGDNNGGKRLVPSRRNPRSLPTNVKQRKANLRPKKCFKNHKRRLRPSITPGTILILLAGRHRGKRVVFLKQLASGLLLVTGPVKLNGCPLRRIAQSFVIATRTRIDLSGITLPERVTDLYFRRLRQVKKAGSESALFAKQTQTYQLTLERKEDQRAVDSQVMGAIKKTDDGKLLIAYMRSLFSLKNGQKPHSMVF